MTETRKWTLGAVLVAVLILVAGWFLLISPKRADVAELQTQTDAQLDQNSSLQTEIAVLKQQNKDLPEKQAELAALQTKIPQAPDLAGYVREMQDLGRKSGVAFTSLTPAAPLPVGGAPVSTTVALPPEALAAINVDMVVAGGYFEITKFINELETASRYTLVSGYVIAEEEGADEEGATSGPAGLTATINARIYLVPSTPEVTDPSTTTSTVPAPAPTTSTAP
jgi:type IV pilus assembly protein PilO